MADPLERIPDRTDSRRLVCYRRFHQAVVRSAAATIVVAARGKP